MISLILTFLVVRNLWVDSLEGSQMEKDRILAATVWTLQEEGYEQDDIALIFSDYNATKGQVYSTYVAFKDDQDTLYIYSWEDKEVKKDVKLVGETGNSFSE